MNLTSQSRKDSSVDGQLETEVKLNRSLVSREGGVRFYGGPKILEDSMQRLNKNHELEDFNVDLQHTVQYSTPMGQVILTQEEQSLNNKKMSLGAEKEDRDRQAIWKRKCFKLIYLCLHFVFRIKQVFVKKKRIRQLPKIILFNIYDQGSKMYQRPSLTAAHPEHMNLGHKSKCMRQIALYALLLKQRFKRYYRPLLRCLNSLHKSALRRINRLPVILPFQGLGMLWDFMHIAFIIINLMVIPMRVSFTSLEIGAAPRAVNQAVFIFNVVLHINKAYYKKGLLIKSRQEIFHNFIRSHLLKEILCLVSVCSEAPFGLLHLRLLFLLKLKDISMFIKTYRSSYLSSKRLNLWLNYALLLLEIIFVCHLFACFWNNIGSYEMGNGVPGNWIEYYGLRDSAIQKRYAR